MGVTYKLTPFGKAHMPLPGVKWEDLTAEEYEAACARHPGMEEHDYFVRVEEQEEDVYRPPRTRGVVINKQPETAEETTDG